MNIRRADGVRLQTCGLGARLAAWSLACIVLGVGSGRAEEPSSTRSEPADPWSIHGQLTYQLQGHGTFDAPYAGQNSLQDREETRGSFTATLFLGRRLWKGGEVYGNGELIAGSGVSKVLGLAGPPNGETYRVDSTELKASFARLFLRQTWNFGGASDGVESGQNQVAGRRTRRRVVLTAGKFSGTDVFDGNAYAHDTRTQFNNWSLWANAAWDYPADTRGYTWGVAAEAYFDDWAARLGVLMEPLEANGLEMDHDFRHAHGDVLEVEHDHQVKGRAGAVRFLGFVNHARMGIYRDAIEANPSAPDVTTTRAPGRVKYGFGFNAEQAIMSDIGIFLRAGWNDGATESWAFTEVERTVTFGVSVSGASWKRMDDHIGVAVAANGINQDHRDYFAHGGYGFMLGDGRLSYSAERLLDAYYSFAASTFCFLSVEAQRYENLAFNADRSPVSVYGARVHFEF